VTEAFRYRLRVRYHECDAQKIVFNARYAEYVDVAAGEYCRALFGSLEPPGFDWRLVRQLLQWKRPARYDDVVEIGIVTSRVGTSSFTLTASLSRARDAALLCDAETVYVVVDPARDQKRALTDAERRVLEAGAPGVVIDHAGTRG
jgi:acyl-CoA thioester hydrolase